MRMWKAGVVLCALATVAVARPARAQGTGIIPLRAKLGVFLPSGDAKRFAGSTQYDGEVDVALPHLGSGRYMLSAGYYRGSRNGQRLRMIPVTIARIFSPPNPAQRVTGNLYYGVGLGAYFLHASGGGVSAGKTRPGGFGLVGYQFPGPYFLEAKYHIAGSVAGISPHGLALMIGRNF